MNSAITQPSTPLLYILSQQASAYQSLWQQAGVDGIELTQDASQATIVLADPPLLAQQLSEFPQLQWAQSTFAGIDTLTQAHLRHDYLLTNVKGIFGQLISEYVLGYSLSYFRHFQHYQQQQNDLTWQPRQYQSVMGKTIVILGTGSIGNQLATSTAALGFIPIGVNRSGQAPDNSPFAQVYRIDEVAQALPKADIVVNALPSTPHTRGIINEQLLSDCRHTLLFNIGRGDAVEEQGLLVALENGWVDHAYLDVFPVEPLPQHSPYWQHPNITITPHIAANSFPEQVFAIFKQNCQRWLSNQPLLNQVEFARGY